MKAANVCCGFCCAGLIALCASVRVSAAGEEAPFLIHDSGGPGASHPCTGYIDPRFETLRGADLNVGLGSVRLVFNEEVFGPGGAPLAPEDFIVHETGITFGIDESQEPPGGTGSSAFGIGNVALNEDRTALHIRVNHDVQDVTNGHVHRGAPGENGPPIFTFMPPASPFEDNWFLTPADITDLESGNLYVNLHSPIFPSGEIRGQIVPNRVVEVDAQNNPEVIVTLLRPPSLQEWTTIQAVVENAAGVPITTLGDLGPGVEEPDRVDISFLPADVDQSGTVRPLDLLRFRQGMAGLYEPPCGQASDYLDIDRNTLLDGFDLLRLRQLIFGTGPTTKPWASETTYHPQP